MSDPRSHRLSIQRFVNQLHTRVGATRYSAAEFLVALVSFLVVIPMVDGLSQAGAIEGVLLTLVLGSAVLAVGTSRRSLMIALSLSIPAILLKWLNHFSPESFPAELFLGMGIAFVGFVLFCLLKFILGSSRVSNDVLCAGIATYLTIGLLWAFAYLLVSRADPSSFSFPGATSGHVLKGFDFLYFSYVTLTTVGLGDIAPVSPMARMLAVLEVLSGTIYMAVLVARLVSMHGAEIQSTSQQGPSV